MNLNSESFNYIGNWLSADIFQSSTDEFEHRIGHFGPLWTFAAIKLKVTQASTNTVVFI